MQPDPLGVGAADATNPQSLNLYGYVGNDPVNFVDPSGMNRRLVVTFTCEMDFDGRTCGYEWYWEDDGQDSSGGGGSGGGEIDSQ